MIKDGKIIYSEPVLLGDRIKIISVSVDDPQEYDNGVVTVTLLNRPPEAPMTVVPIEEATSQYAFQDNGNLMIVLE